MLLREWKLSISQNKNNNILTNIAGTPKKHANIIKMDKRIREPTNANKNYRPNKKSPEWRNAETSNKNKSLKMQ